MNTDYHINVVYSHEDGVWIAHIPELVHCSAHGATPQEAVVEVEQAAAAWLDAARGLGRPLPAKSVRVVGA